MQCPVCTTERLATSERHGIEIDYCPRCRGVWLDRGELDKLIEQGAKVEKGTAAPMLMVAPPPAAPAATRGNDGDDDPAAKTGPRRTFLSDLFNID